MTTPPSTLKTVRDVAAELRVSTHAVYRWVSEERLKPVRVGALLRFTDAAIEDFLRSGNQTTDELGVRRSRDPRSPLAYDPHRPQRLDPGEPVDPETTHSTDGRGDRSHRRSRRQSERGPGLTTPGPSES